MSGQRALSGLFASIVMLLPTAVLAQDPTYDMTVKISRRDGTPAAGLHVKTYFYNVANKLIPVYEGDLPADGTFRLEGLKGGKGRPVYRIYAGPNEEQIDTFRYEGPGEQPLHEVKLPLMAGETAPDVSFINILTGERSKLSDYRGQLVYLDFWATWCVPCRRPMLHSQDVMKRRSAEWKGKAAIIALSGDETQDVAKKYVIERGWTDIIHMWNIDSAGTGGQMQAILDFGIDDIPRAVFIDANGTILWRGDPNLVDPEKMIDERLR